MKWLKEILIKRYVLGLTDKILAKIPANGRKSVVGIMIMLLTIAVTYFQGHPVLPILMAALELLQGMDHVAYGPEVVAFVAGMITALIGLFHKLVKYFIKEK